jgi:hypothetical protein
MTQMYITYNHPLGQFACILKENMSRGNSVGIFARLLVGRQGYFMFK